MAEDGKDLTPDRFRKLLDDDGVSNPRPATKRANPRAGPGPSSATSTRPATTKGSDWPAASPSWLSAWCSGSNRCWRRGGRRSASSPTTAGCWCPRDCRRPTCRSISTATRWRRCAVVKPAATVEVPVLLLVLGRRRADRLPARNRLLHRGQGVQPRGLELAGMRRAAARRPRLAPSRWFQRKSSRSSGPGCAAASRLRATSTAAGRSAGQGRGPDDLAG